MKGMQNFQNSEVVDGVRWFYIPADEEIGLMLDGTNCSDDEMVIPPVLGGESVESICIRHNDSHVRSVRIPKYVNDISPRSFKEFVFHKAFTVDEENQYFCAVDGVLYTKDMKKLVLCPRHHIKPVDIPFGVEDIGENAFSGSKVTAVRIPSTVMRICDYAFQDCSFLREIELPPSLTSVGWEAFAGTRIAEVNINSGLKRIEYGSFGKCERLEKITVDQKNVAYKVVDGVLYHKRRKELVCCPDTRQSFCVPAWVKSIGPGAFNGCRHLATLTIPEGVRHVDCAFSECNALTSLTFPRSVRSIGECMFDIGNKKLKRVVFLGPPPVIPSDFASWNDMIETVYTSEFEAAWSDFIRENNLKGRCQKVFNHAPNLL